MPRPRLVTTGTYLFSTTSTRGAAQIVATSFRIIFDPQWGHYDTARCLISGNARGVLPLETAVWLRDTVDGAIEAERGGSAQQNGPLEARHGPRRCRALRGEGRLQARGVVGAPPEPPEGAGTAENPASPLFQPGTPYAAGVALSSAVPTPDNLGFSKSDNSLVGQPMSDFSTPDVLIGGDN